MIIKFKLGNYEEICDEYEAIFEYEDVVDVEEGNDCLVVRTRRIVVPALHASFREAVWYTKDEEAEDEEERETQASVIVHYEEHETDPAKYISYATCDLTYFAEELAENLDFDDCDVSDLEGYIDTEEFIDEATLKTILGE